jgi:hypothetical protein
MILTFIENVKNVCPLLGDMLEFGKLIAVHIAEYCRLLHKYSVLVPPSHGDCWHT